MIFDNKILQAQQMDLLYEYLFFLCFTLGAYKLVKLLVGVATPFLTWRLDLKRRYNGGWALVTGGSQGIGLALAQQLAQQGFNIILISRSLTKLQQAKSRISSIHPHIEIQLKSIDFQMITSEEQYLNAFKQFFQKDVSILVNNVGYFIPRSFAQKSFEQNRKQLKINCLPISILSRIFIQRMIKRQCRSAIINLGSLSSDVVFAGASNYSATKRFISFFSQALSYEYKDQIDILTAKPFFVATKMIKNLDEAMTVSADQAAKDIVNALGNKAVIFGSFKHSLQGSIMGEVHHELVAYISTALFSQFRKKYDQQKIQ